MKKVNTCETAAGTPMNGASARVIESYNGGSDKAELADLRLPSALIGRIVAIRESGEPFIDFPSNASGELVSARSLVRVSAAETNREVALMFEDGDSTKPIIIGLLQSR